MKARHESLHNLTTVIRMLALLSTALCLTPSAIAAPLPYQVTIHPIYVQTSDASQTAVVTAGYSSLLPQFQEATQKIFAQAGVRLVWETPTTFASTDCYDLNTGITNGTFIDAMHRASTMGSGPASYGGSTTAKVINLWFTGEQNSIIASGYTSTPTRVVPGATVSQSIFGTPYALDVIAQVIGYTLGMGNGTLPASPNLMCIGYAGASSLAQITTNGTTGLDILTPSQIAVLALSPLLQTNATPGDQYIYGSTYYIRAGATGTGDGSSWTNAWPSFSAATWVRGGVYYVAGGTYTENVTIAAPLFGSQWITIRKATVTENSADPGWSATYGTTQAVINGTLTLDNGYVELNGVVGSDTSGHGFKINNPASTTVLNLTSSTGPYTILHSEVSGPGHASATAYDGISHVNPTTPQKNLYIGYCWIHEVSHNGLTLAGLVGTSYGDYGVLFANNVVSEIGGGAAAGQGMQLGSAAEDGFAIISSNRFRNIAGTAMLAWLNGTGSNHHDARVYNNLFYLTDLATYHTLSSGVIYSDATATAATNLAVENNTFYGLGSATVTTASGRVNVSTAGATTITLVNNLWENCYFPAVHVGITAESNNGYYNNTGIPPSGTSSQVDGASTAFTNAAGADFTLATGRYAVGQGQTLNSSFTTDFTGLKRGGLWDLGAYQLQTAKGTPTITTLPVPEPSTIARGDMLYASTLVGGSASEPGAFAFTDPATIMTTAGTYAASVTFTPTDTDNYNIVTFDVNVTVNKTTSGIDTLPTGSAITYGQALSASTLSGGVASASLPGSFAYTNPASIPSGAGTASVSITFTPTDATNYSTSTGTIHITVNKATPTISWSTPAPITTGTALSGTQLNATASDPTTFVSVPGTFVYTPASGTVLAVGESQNLSVAFTPTSTANYTTAAGSTTITVNGKTTPSITTAPTATAIIYGQALSVSTLSGGAASVAGTFAFTTPSTTPNAGTASAGITFTPTDTGAYNAATTTISVTVNKATPSVSWSAPAAITYGTALSATQLNATAGVPGTFVYSPASGTVLNASGSSQTLSVTFTPTNTANYATVAGVTTSITVNKATPTVTWSTPAAITYGTALSATQLNATASVPGTLVYSPASGTVLNAGSGQTLSVTFTPTNTGNYNSVAGVTTTITVNKATPTVTWSAPAAISYGTALSSTQLNATASVPGALAYTPASGTVLNVGSGQALSVVFTPTDTANHNSVVRSITITVNKASQTISFAGPSNQPFSTTPITLSGSATSLLTVTFSLVSGPASLGGTSLTLTGTGTVVVRASQAGNGNYLPATDVDRSFTVSANFASWQNTNFTPTELSNAAISGPNAVYGQDGLPNLVKYTLGLAPKTNATTGLPTLSTNGTNWIYTHTRPVAVTDVPVSVEFSSNLTTWTTSGVTLTKTATDGVTDTWQATYPVASAANAFFRLNITQ